MNVDRWIPHRPEYYVQTGGMHENPYGVPKDEIVRMILENPPEVTAQVVFGKYVESSGLVFTGELIQGMIDRNLPRILGNYYIDKQAAADARRLLVSEDIFERTVTFRDDIYSPFHTGVDYARQTDYTVITTVDCRERPARLVYYKRLNRVPWETIYREVGLARMLWGTNILGDSTGMGGDVVQDALHSRQFCPKHKLTSLVGSFCTRDGRQLDCDPEDYLLLSCVEGFNFQTGPKRELVEHLRNVMSVGYDAENPSASFGWLRVPPIVQLEEEMSFYSWDDKKLSTDCLFSLALAVWDGLEDPVEEAAFGSIFGQ